MHPYSFLMQHSRFHKSYTMRFRQAIDVTFLRWSLKQLVDSNCSRFALVQMKPVTTSDFGNPRTEVKDAETWRVASELSDGRFGARSTDAAKPHSPCFTSTKGKRNDARHPYFAPIDALSSRPRQEMDEYRNPASERS